ncbi:MAG: hypothetical protein EOM26_05710 [Alphaproteobacteria bacterium]|nr:hypothetical protein [Alphaproteobacteria bacterium]
MKTTIWENSEGYMVVVNPKHFGNFEEGKAAFKGAVPGGLPDTFNEKSTFGLHSFRELLELIGVTDGVKDTGIGRLPEGTEIADVALDAVADLSGQTVPQRESGASEQRLGATTYPGAPESEIIYERAPDRPADDRGVQETDIVERPAPDRSEPLMAGAIGAGGTRSTDGFNSDARTREERGNGRTSEEPYTHEHSEDYYLFNGGAVLDGGLLAAAGGNKGNTTRFAGLESHQEERRKEEERYDSGSHILRSFIASASSFAVEEIARLDREIANLEAEIAELEEKLEAATLRADVSREHLIEVAAENDAAQAELQEAAQAVADTEQQLDSQETQAEIRGQAVGSVQEISALRLQEAGEARENYEAALEEHMVDDTGNRIEVDTSNPDDPKFFIRNESGETVELNSEQQARYAAIWEQEAKPFLEQEQELREQAEVLAVHANETLHDIHIEEVAIAEATRQELQELRNDFRDAKVKAETLQQEYEKAVETYGKDSAQVQRLQTELDAANEEIAELRVQRQETLEFQRDLQNMDVNGASATEIYDAMPEHMRERYLERNPTFANRLEQERNGPFAHPEQVQIAQTDPRSIQSAANSGIETNISPTVAFNSAAPGTQPDPAPIAPGQDQDPTNSVVAQTYQSRPIAPAGMAV